MALLLSKVSGVLFVTDSSSRNPRSYYGGSGHFQISDDNTLVILTIGTLQWQTTWQTLSVNGQIPTTLSQAQTLLNAIFGT